MRNPRSFLYAALMLFAVVLPLAGLEVNSEELRRGKYGDISFTNYQGPHRKIDTVDQIIGIGEYLGNQLLREGADSADYRGRYRILRVVRPEIKSGLDADIFILLPSAEVDHIDNLRRMIAGYFMAYYKYSREDSLLLAEFVTLYNAAYRKDMGFFRERYKDPVIDALDAEKAGLATHYEEWPGNSMLLIPLTRQAAAEGEIGSLDSDELTEEKVEEDLRSREDKGVESRQDMVELKEREVEEEKREIEEEKEEIEEKETEIIRKEEEITEKEETLRERESELAEQKEELEEKKEKAEEEGAAEEVKEEIAKEEENLAKEEEEVSRQKESVEEEKEQLQAEKDELEEQKEEVAAREEKTEEREEKIQEEREKIAQDTRELIEKEEDVEASRAEEEINSEEAEYIYFLVLGEGRGEPEGKFVLLNTTTGTIASTSSVTSVKNRRFDVYNDNLLVIAGEETSRLFLIDPDNLEVIAQGQEVLFSESAMLINGPDIFAVVEDGAVHRVGKFNGNLEQIELSEISVNPYTVMILNKNRLFVQNAEGGIVTLSADDLRYAE